MGTTRIQYALVHESDGSPAYFTHQDDMETPLVADSLENLIGLIGDWCDCGISYVLENLKDGTFIDETMDEDEVFKIVRLEVRVDDLQAADFAEIERLQRGDGDEEDEEDEE